MKSMSHLLTEFLNQDAPWYGLVLFILYWAARKASRHFVSSAKNKAVSEAKVRLTQITIYAEVKGRDALAAAGKSLVWIVPPISRRHQRPLVRQARRLAIAHLDRRGASTDILDDMTAVDATVTSVVRVTVIEILRELHRRSLEDSTYRFGISLLLLSPSAIVFGGVKALSGLTPLPIALITFGVGLAITGFCLADPARTVAQMRAGLIVAALGCVGLLAVPVNPSPMIAMNCTAAMTLIAIIYLWGCSTNMLATRVALILWAMVAGAAVFIHDEAVLQVIGVATVFNAIGGWRAARSDGDFFKRLVGLLLEIKLPTK